MGVYKIDPVCDPRWVELLQRTPRASVFHTSAWLQALKRTYGYEPIAYTTSAPGAELVNGWVFCRVRSWLTGRRLVSLPFSDHCDPIVDTPETLDELSQELRHDREERRWNYIEYRPLTVATALDGFGSSETFCFHKLDLRHDLNELFCAFHKDSTQRKIRRAEREGLSYERGCSEGLLDKFYHLLVLTRRRHRLPPQPRTWFSNLANCMGHQMTVRVASNNGIPVASIITLSFKKTLVYKYGSTDERFFRLGGIQMLLWRAIEEAKERKLQEFDLGRSECYDQGLIVFKNRLGADRASLNYFRYPIGMRHTFAVRRARQRNAFLSYMPLCLLKTGGRLLYKHFG